MVEPRIVNLTPHAITLRDTDTGIDTVYPSAGVARVSSTPGEQIAVIPPGIELVTAPTWGAVEGLPSPTAHTIYVVSSVVAAHVTDRPDVFSPGTGPGDGAVRNEAGQVVAVTRLVRSTPAARATSPEPIRITCGHCDYRYDLPAGQQHGCCPMCGTQ